jgi:hypothetical protein
VTLFDVQLSFVSLEAMGTSQSTLNDITPSTSTSTLQEEPNAECKLCSNQNQMFSVQLKEQSRDFLAQLDALHRELAAQRQDVINEEAKFAAKETEAKDLKRKNREYESIIRMLKDEIAEKKDENEKLKNTIKEMEEKDEKYGPQSKRLKTDNSSPSPPFFAPMPSSSSPFASPSPANSPPPSPSRYSTPPSRTRSSYTSSIPLTPSTRLHSSSTPPSPTRTSSSPSAPTRAPPSPPTRTSSSPSAPTRASPSSSSSPP